MTLILINLVYKLLFLTTTDDSLQLVAVPATLRTQVMEINASNVMPIVKHAMDLQKTTAFLVLILFLLLE